DLDQEPPRLLVQLGLFVRPGWGGGHPPCRSGERHPPDGGTTVVVLAAQAVESGGRGQIAGAVIEELAGKRARFGPSGMLASCEPGHRLDHAVEAPTVGPRSVVTPRVDDHDDGTWVSFGDLLRREPEAVQGTRPIAMDENIGLVDEGVKAVRAVG